MSNKLIIFDLDNTILNGDSDYEWIKFLIDSGHVDNDYFSKKNEYFYNQWTQGSLDYREWLEFVLLTLKDKKLEQADDLLKHFMTSAIEPIINIYALRLLHDHFHNNDLMLLASASNSAIVKPIAARLNFSNVISTEAEIIEGRYTGKIIGELALGEGKLSKVKTWMSSNGINSFENTTFYSDSIYDLPLLSIVKNPIAVNPDDDLRAVCVKNNWEIIDLPVH